MKHVRRVSNKQIKKVTSCFLTVFLKGLTKNSVGGCCPSLRQGHFIVSAHSTGRVVPEGPTIGCVRGGGTARSRRQSPDEGAGVAHWDVSEVVFYCLR